MNVKAKDNEKNINFSQLKISLENKIVIIFDSIKYVKYSF